MLHFVEVFVTNIIYCWKQTDANYTLLMFSGMLTTIHQWHVFE